MALKENEKLQRFADDVLRQANAERDEILGETQQQYEQLLKEGAEQIRKEADRLIETETKELRRKSNLQLSQQTMQERKELLLYRESLIQSLLDNVTERITAFTTSDEYRDYLIRLCMLVLSERDAVFTLYLSQRDMKYKDDLLNAVKERKPAGKISDILPERSIRLGGIRFWSEGSGMLINETIDENLARKQKDFVRLIGPVS